MLFFVWAVLSLVAGWLGRNRQFGFWGFFLASLVFSPVVVLLVWALTDPVYKGTGTAP